MECEDPSLFESVGEWLGWACVMVFVVGTAYLTGWMKRKPAGK